MRNLVKVLCAPITAQKLLRSIKYSQKNPIVKTIIFLIPFLFLSQLATSQDVERIMGGNSPDQFNNFANSAPDPSYTGDVSYTINLGQVIAGGVLDFPLVLTYNSNRVMENIGSGIVGVGWDFDLGEVVRGVNHIPDEQSSLFFANTPNDMDNTSPFYIASTGGSGAHAQVQEDGIIHAGDNLQNNIYVDEWDSYNMSTPYDNANLMPIKPADGITPFYFLEKPYKNWEINYLRNSDNQYFGHFNMRDEMGRYFKYDYTHYARVDNNGDGIRNTSEDHYFRYPVAWKLTEITSPNTTHTVDFIYDDFAHTGDEMDTKPSNRKPFTIGDVNQYLVLATWTSMPGPDVGGNFLSYDESVLDRIETDFQIIRFYYADDGYSSINTLLHLLERFTGKF